jgi:diaminohydroxyphosphoribosylaminopyrimidine deaminase/5-amino-6-(5-phosphoribosylamino)uracil reductase
VADFKGGSKWITSPAARREVQEIRRRHSAVAVGKNTLLRDDPKLTARCGKIYYPARIVFSPDTKIPKNSYFFTHSDEARSIVVVKGSKKRGIERKGGLEFWHTGSNGYAESIDTFLDMAYSEELTSILIEGGQKLASGFLENGFVNKVHLFYGNKIFGGGTEGLRFARGLAVGGCLSLDKISRRSFGDDFLVTGYVKVK